MEFIFINLAYNNIFVNNSWLEISTSNLRHNLRQFRGILGRKVLLAPAVKSNAYGHGMVLVAKVIQREVDWLSVVNLDEALELRKNGIKKPILVLSYYFGDLGLAVKNNISLVVYSLASARAINAAAKKINKTAKIHFKYDTGTSRLGVVGESEALKTIKEIKKYRNIEIEGVFSHFAASEENQKFTDLQIKRFNSFVAKLEKAGINILLKHFACSAAALVRPDSRFNLIRLGIGLYGLWPSAAAKKLTLKIYPKFSLRPVLAWKTRVIAVKYVGKGACIGYGCTYKPARPTKLAILPVGYFEGYDRHLSNKGEVLINGVRCPVRGRVSMNLTIVEVTKAGPVPVGAEAVLIGRQGKLEITAEDLAEKIGTINYEIVARINPLLPRQLT
ncbi:MAG: alanine racemase [Patescibacteria group bacterium]|jgi:alanine racemase